MSCSAYTTDESYVTDIRKGGASMEHATDCLYRAYRENVLRMVKSFLRFRSGMAEDAQDVIQDAFLIMIEKIRDGGYNEGSLVHFWTGITKGLLRNKFKRDARTDLTDDNREFDSMDTESPEQLMIWHEQRETLDEVLNRLGARCKKVLLMWAGGYSMEEIAVAMDLSSEAMARKTKYRCKNQLMEFIDELKLKL
jgi:RNA polymerase sigma factor (sigma-70 family)